MGIVTTILWFLIALVVLVAVHEYGHFYVARRCGVKVIRFSIGFGSKLFSWHDRHGTEFALSAIPLGGYVKMLDEREMEVSEEEAQYSFNNQHPWKKIAIASAGPIANILLAILFFWCLVFFQGRYSIAPIVDEVKPESLAAQAGLVSGQEIVAIDGEPMRSRRDVYMALFKRLGESGSITFTTKYPDADLLYTSDATLDNWMRGVKQPDVVGGAGLSFYRPPTQKVVVAVEDESAAMQADFQAEDEIYSVDGVELEDGDSWIEYVRARPEVPIDVTVLRAGEQVDLKLVPDPLEVGSNCEIIGRAGVHMLGTPYPEEMRRRITFGPLESLGEAVKSSVNTVDMVFMSIKKLIFKEISLNNLSGPIGIAKVAGDSGRAGFWVFISFLATLSVYLGVLNLLPVPVLDGGHIVYSVVEWVKGSPLSERIQMLGYQAGLAMILCLFIVASFHDVTPACS